MIIQHNIAALNAYRQLNSNTTSVSKNLEKLSSGYAINRAGDDASGLAISEKMRAQISGLQVAQDNAQDGISLVQTAEGALTEVHAMLNRAVELAEKSANGTIQDDVDREAIQKEVDDIISEIDRISESTNFNGIKLLDGTLGASTSTNQASGSIGATQSSLATVTMEGLAVGSVVNFKTATAVNDTDAIGVAYNETDKTLTITLTSGNTGANTYTSANINNAINQAYASNTTGNAALAGVSITTNNSFALDNTTEDLNLGTIIFDETATASTKANDVYGVDTDFSLTATASGATGITSFTFANSATTQGVSNVNGAVTITLKTGSSYSASDVTEMLQGQGIEWKASFEGTKSAADILGDADDGYGTAAMAVTDGTGAAAEGLTLQIGDSNDSFQKVTVAIDDLSSEGLGISSLDVSTQDAAGNAIQSIKDAINKVSTNRGNLGGLQNRLEYTINNLTVTEENMTAAESNIRDTDMASEMMAYTKNNVLTQAAQAMLAQANTQPQSVLQLLQ